MTTFIIIFMLAMCVILLIELWLIIREYNKTRECLKESIDISHTACQRARTWYRAYLAADKACEEKQNEIERLRRIALLACDMGMAQAEEMERLKENNEDLERIAQKAAKCLEIAIQKAGELAEQEEVWRNLLRLAIFGELTHQHVNELRDAFLQFEEN